MTSPVLFARVSSRLRRPALAACWLMAVVIGSGSLVKGDDLIYATPYTFFTMAGEAGGSTLGYRDGVGSAARFGNLTGVAVDGAGNVYVADDVYVTGTNTIRKGVPPPPGLAEEAKEWGQKVAVIIVVGLLAVTILAVIWSDRRKAKAGGGGAR